MALSLGPDYWDSVAREIKYYHLESNIADYYKEEHIKLIKEWGGDLKGKVVLKTDLYEEAFGKNSFLPWLLQQGADCFAMDISQEIANRASLSFKGCVVSDIRECVFKDNSFDLIISNSTLDNLHSEDVPQALSELRRILNPQGVLILTLDNAHNPLYSLGYLIEKFWHTNKYYQGHCYSINLIKRLAEQNGFIVQKLSSIVHIPTPFNKFAILLRKTNSKYIEKAIKSLVGLFSKLGNQKTKFLTGWFIAVKLTKK